MKRTRLTEEQIIVVLKEVEAGAKTADLAWRHGVPEATIYNSKAQYGGLEVSDAKRLQALDDENTKLKRLLAEAMPHIAGLEDFLAIIGDAASKREAVACLQAFLEASERRVCRIIGIDPKSMFSRLLGGTMRRFGRS